MHGENDQEQLKTSSVVSLHRQYATNSLSFFVSEVPSSSNGLPFYPSSVKSGEANRGRLIETIPGRAFIFFLASVKQDDIPGFEPDLTEEGLEHLILSYSYKCLYNQINYMSFFDPPIFQSSYCNTPIYRID